MRYIVGQAINIHASEVILLVNDWLNAFVIIVIFYLMIVQVNAYVSKMRKNKFVIFFYFVNERECQETECVSEWVPKHSEYLFEWVNVCVIKLRVLV